MFDTSPQLDCAGRVLKLDVPRVMGIVNATPDSFSDGGEHFDAEAAVAHGLRLAGEGADLLDIGGESTRPGASEVSAEEEIRRTVPVIEALAKQVSIPISIDTSKPEVMRAAVAAGAGMINDVYALRREGALDAASELRVPVVLMHMQGEPRTMQANPGYDDVVAEVFGALAARAEAARAAGVARDRIWLDPGVGFGKTAEHNLALTAHLERLAALGFPVLYGASRKRVVQAVDPTADDPGDRIGGSLALALEAARRGAAVIRVHDVRQTVQALKLQAAVANAAKG